MCGPVSTKARRCSTQAKAQEQTIRRAQEDAGGEEKYNANGYTEHACFMFAVTIESAECSLAIRIGLAAHAPVCTCTTGA